MQTNASLSRSRAAALTAAACFLYMVSGGIRCSMGVMVEAISARTGISYADVSFVIAVGQLMYGVTQPLFGMLALRRSSAAVLLTGAGLITSGLALSSVAGSQGMLLLSLGLLFYSGTGALCFGMIMGAISPLLGSRRAAAVSGVLNAASGVGTSLLSPAIQALTAGAGVAATLRALCIPAALLIPAVLFIARTAREAGPQAGGSGGKTDTLALLRTAVAHPDYRRLMAGFFTCGFHMCIIQTHLFKQILGYGIDPGAAALAYTVYGLVTMAGSVLSGVLCQRLPRKNVLGTLYGIRAVIVAAFLFLLPKNVLTVYLFVIVLALTGDATVTPTSGIISERFGPASMGFLFGVTFVCHQIGGFLSSWLGGLFISGGQTAVIWVIDIALCAFASLASYGIRRETPPLSHG